MCLPEQNKPTRLVMGIVVEGRTSVGEKGHLEARSLEGRPIQAGKIDPVECALVGQAAYLRNLGARSLEDTDRNQHS